MAYLSYAGKRFIQIHTSQKDLKLKGVIDSDVSNYAILDLADS